MKINIRSAVAADFPFIFATYIRNRWFDKNNRTTLKRATWSKLQHQRVEQILNNNKVLVACLDEDWDIIVGYSFMDGSEPWVYVKLDWRAPGLSVKENLLKEIK